MGYLSVSRAVSVRLLFATHGMVSIWRLCDVTQEKCYWYLSSTLGLLFVESIVTLVKRQGKEWKWFCPSVFIYLLTSVPAIWLLELHEFERRAKYHMRQVRLARLNNQTADPTEGPPDIQEDLSAPIGSVLGIRFEIRIPIKLTGDQWIRMLEQLLLLILIMGRWMLPKGKLTHDQLSQLLLVYIGTAADIVEFFEAFKEKEVRYHKLLCMVILGIWSLSLIQFSLVLTAARVRRDQSGLYGFSLTNDINKRRFRADLFGILISIFLQDLPFLVLRMLLIFQYSVLSYTNMFFTSKNTLVILLLTYRLVVVFVQGHASADDTLPYYFPMDRRESLFSYDAFSTQETGIFQVTPEVQKPLLPVYPLEYHIEAVKDTSRVFYVRDEKHKYGRAYYFEEVDNQLL